MKKLSINEVRQKTIFLSNCLDYNIELEYGKSNCAIWNNYGMKGSECVFAGSLSECNNYLNRLLRKEDIVDDWKEFKNNK